MNRLQKTLEDLNQKGYSLGSLIKISGGINSAVFQAKSKNDMKYAVKLYKQPSKDDSRNRCQTEKDFLSYLQSCEIKNTSSLIESNISAGWSLMNWIEGQKPTNLDPIDLQEIADFIVHINEASKETTRYQLQPASEACESLPGLIASIAKRLKRLQSITPSSETSQEAIQWITKTLEPYFQSIRQRLLTTRATCSQWRDLHACRIASPSDVGIHNTLRTQQGLHFLDFEYAGLDDLSKLAADWILQPEHPFSKEQEESFCDLLTSKMRNHVGDSWRDRLNDIKPLIHVKWCLIMLNQLQVHKLSKQQIQKTMAYFELR